MKRYINWLLNGFAITFAVPSFLIIISWNALPGDRLYGVKTGLENIALGITIKTPLASVLSVKYTERRFDEANNLLSSKGSALGYALLIQEAKKSQNIIVEKKDKAQARELINQIQKYKKRIQEKKIGIEEGYVEVPVSKEPGDKPPEPTRSPSPTPILYSPTPVPIPDVITPENSQGEVILKLEETEAELEKIEVELETHAASLQGILAKPTPADQPGKSDSHRQDRSFQENKTIKESGLDQTLPPENTESAP